MSHQGARIVLCGRLRVLVGGEQREEQLRGRQGRLLFAYLALHRERPVPRSLLVDALWGHSAAPPGDGALAPVLSRLRGAVTPAEIAGREALQLRLPEPAWVDIEAARGALTQARAAHAQARTDPHALTAVLDAAQEAAGLLEAELLPGLDAPWIEEARTELEHARLEALELAAEAAHELDPPLAERLARTAVSVSPFRESSWVALICALRARGNIAEALQAYDDVRRLLRDELGTNPGPALLALHAALLSAGERPAAAHASPTATGVPNESSPRAETTHRSAATPRADLVEREDELRAVEGVLTRVANGTGAVVLFEGPAGIGKTRLLDELGTRAQERAVNVLSARAGLLEREFAFGVVRQLLEGAVNPASVEGPAAAVLGDGGAAEGTFPILNGLFRLVQGLGARGPLALCVDDLQWSDPGSLRFVAYLARRLRQLPVLLAATVRTGEPDADEALLSELAQEPVTVSLNPRPLTLGATATMIADRLGATPDPAFAQACHEVTAGNPLLLGRLLSALAGERVAPDASGASAVRAIGPRAVARTVLARVARLPEPAQAVARAVAVLGEQPSLPAVAGLAGTNERSAARAVEALTRAEILRADALGFVHPLIRESVYEELPAPARALEHQRAARLLDDLGAAPERVAAQLLQTDPRGDGWVVSRLREAANLALHRGAPDTAMRLLERAQAEPPPAEQRAALALELGGSAAYLRGPAGVEPLQRAYAELRDPAERAQAAIRLGHLLLFVRSPREGVALADQAGQELPPELSDARDGLRAIRLIGAAFGAVDPAEFRRLEDVRRGPRGTGPGARALSAMAAFAVAVSCEPASEASALAREAFSAGVAALEISAPMALGSAALALGEPADGLRAIEEYGEYARRSGEILSSIGADLWGGIAQIWAGDLSRAMELLERAHEGERLWGTKLDAVMAYSAAFTALGQLERGDPPAAAAETLHRVSAEDPRPDGARFWLASLTELALAEGRAQDAVEITERLEPTRPPQTHPVWAPWRSLRARALGMLDQREAALGLAHEDLALARRIGAPWVIGRALRLIAELSGAAGTGAAEEAVAKLSGSSARLELAKAHLALGQARIAAGQDGASALEAADVIARQCGAARLAQRSVEARTSRAATPTAR